MCVGPFFAVDVGIDLASLCLSPDISSGDKRLLVIASLLSSRTDISGNGTLRYKLRFVGNDRCAGSGFDSAARCLLPIIANGVKAVTLR